MTKTDSLRLAMAAALALSCQVGMTPALAAQSSADVDAMISDALNLLRSNHNAEAASELKQAIKLNPKSAEAHHNYGLALAKLGDVQGAIAELKQATILKPELDASWLTLGGLQQSAGQIEDALSSYTEWTTRFRDRTDLNDIRPKVADLITSLQNERTKKSETRVLQEDRQALLQTPAKFLTNDDYLEEATKGKIVNWKPSRMPLRVYIHDARAVEGFKPKYQQLLVKSLNDWAAASNGRISFKFVDDPQSCDLDCKFSPSPLKNDGATAEGEAGEAKMYYGPEPHGDANTYLQMGKLTLFTKSMSDVLPLTDNRMRFACLHEIGHALGITGHTTNPDDIMFYSSSFKDEWHDLSGRDARTIQRLYDSK